MSETATMTLTEFLLARIAEDEAVAHAVGSCPPQPRLSAIRMMVGDHDAPGSHDGPAIGMQVDPRYVLAECEAKRRIMALHTGIQDHPEDWSQEEWAGANAIAEDCLRALALPFADHPDYRPEWAT